MNDLDITAELAESAYKVVKAYHEKKLRELDEMRKTKNVYTFTDAEKDVLVNVLKTAHGYNKNEWILDLLIKRLTGESE